MAMRFSALCDDISGIPPLLVTENARVVDAIFSARQLVALLLSISESLDRVAAPQVLQECIREREVVAANHCRELLKNDPGRPWTLKQWSRRRGLSSAAPLKTVRRGR